MALNDTAIFHEIYQSQLGIFELRLTSTNTLFQVVTAADGARRTAGHSVLIRKIAAPLDWFPSGMKVETATAWLFYITKHNLSGEQLTFTIELSADSAIQGTTDTGQYLWAVEFENGIRQAHIGTEDEEAMAFRAARQDWMPPRLGSALAKDDLPVTSSSPDKRGLRTQIPQLLPGEEFYFHYIVAENPYRKSVDYPDEMDISTWYAVSQTKKRLEQAWQAQNPNPTSTTGKA